MPALNNIIVGLLVLVLVLSRQLQPRTVKEERPFALMAVLAALGMWQLADYAGGRTIPASAWALLILSLAVGAGLGAVRGQLIHVWRDNGTLMRQGNGLTVALWLVAVGLHIAVDGLIGLTAPHADSLASVSLLLYLAIALGAQRLVTLRRAAAVAV